MNVKPLSSHYTAIDHATKSIQPQEDKLVDWHNDYAKTHRTRLATDLAICESYVSEDANLLELGSAPFILTYALLHSNYRVTGVDIAPHRYQDTLDKTQLRIMKCNIETDPLPFEDNKFDSILFNELFEHLRINLIFTMNETLRVLKPGGRLLLSTPNLCSFRGAVNFLIKGRAIAVGARLYNEYEKLERLGHMGHVREYSYCEVREFLEAVGFEFEQFIFRGPTAKGGLGMAEKVVRAIRPSMAPFVTVIASKPHKQA